MADEISCALTADFSQDDCRKGGIGGYPEMYIIERKNVTFTETTGVITAIVNAEGKRWFKYRLPPNTANAKAGLNANQENGTLWYQHDVSIALNEMKSSTRNELLILARATICVIVKLHNGTYWLYGRNTGLQVANGGGSDTGTAAGDRNGYTLTFSGTDQEIEIEVLKTLIEGENNIFEEGPAPPTP